MQEMVTWPIPEGRSGPAWDIMSLTALWTCQESTEAVWCVFSHFPSQLLYLDAILWSEYKNEIFLIIHGGGGSFQMLVGESRGQRFQGWVLTSQKFSVSDTVERVLISRWGLGPQVNPHLTRKFWWYYPRLVRNCPSASGHVTAFGGVFSHRVVGI